MDINRGIMSHRNSLFITNCLLQKSCSLFTCVFTKHFKGDLSNDDEKYEQRILNEK